MAVDCDIPQEVVNEVKGRVVHKSIAQHDEAAAYTETQKGRQIQDTKVTVDQTLNLNSSRSLKHSSVSRLFLDL